MTAAVFATAAVLTVLLGLRWVLGYLGSQRASEAAERAQILGALEASAGRESATAARVVGVLAESLRPAPLPAVEERRAELENAELERVLAFDASDPFDAIAGVRPSAAPVGDDDDPTGVPGLRLGALDGERWGAS